MIVARRPSLAPASFPLALVFGLVALSQLHCGGGNTSPGADGGDTTDPRRDGGGVNLPDGGDPTDPPVDPIALDFSVQLVPSGETAGVQRVNFAVPLPKGLLTDPSLIKVSVASEEIATGRRALATWPDGSLRSVQLQVEVDVDSVSTLEVEVGAAAEASSLDLVPVEETLVYADGTEGPKVWAQLPASYLAPSGAFGPITAHASIAGTELDAWGLCDYDEFGIQALLAHQDDRGSWLFDRPTALYRGYGMTGDLSPLMSAYREVAMYREHFTGSGSETRIDLLDVGEDDVKYHYTQGFAIHYLLTGDDRFRETAEDVAVRMQDIWSSPGYAGGDDFWTERHAGFGLLAYEWAIAVSDDMASDFAASADEAVDAYLAMQEVDTGEPDARCFAHTASAHGEGFGYTGCSPWMSAILADGLDAYARRVGGAEGEAVRDALVLLGRMFARHRADDGRPHYWIGAGVDQDEADDYDEHWGESAYIVAMAWHYSGREDDELHAAAMDLVEGLAAHGEVGQVRSFNWQCRSGVMGPTFLRE